MNVNVRICDDQGDGDYRIKDPYRIAGLVNRKLSFYTDQRVLPWLGMVDLRPDLFEQARSLLNARRRNHPWVKLSDEVLLRIGGFIRKDPITSAVGYTLAAALMFGSDATIQEAAPATITIFRGKVVFCNPHVPHFCGRIDPARFTPFPKNPTICRFMLQMGRYEQAGSGVYNVTRYLPIYSHGATPIFEERSDVFVTTIPLADSEDTAQVTGVFRGIPGTVFRVQFTYLGLPQSGYSGYSLLIWVFPNRSG